MKRILALLLLAAVPAHAETWAINVDGSKVSNLPWSTVSGTPTTLGGYGITDAAPLASPTFTGTVTFPLLSSVLKANGSGAITGATAGTDYQAPLSLTTTGTSGAATLSGNVLNIPNYATGSSPLTAKGDLFAYSTTGARLPVGADATCLIADSTQTTGLKWGACSGSGTVTSFAFTNGNGLTGTVSNATTTPTLSIASSLGNGIVKIVSGAFALASAGTDYIASIVGSGNIVVNCTSGACTASQSVGPSGSLTSGTLLRSSSTSAFGSDVITSDGAGTLSGIVGVTATGTITAPVINGASTLTLQRASANYIALTSTGIIITKNPVSQYSYYRYLKTIIAAASTGSTQDDLVRCDATSTNVVYTLPTAANGYVSAQTAGQEITIKKVDSGSNTCTIKGNGSENIDDGSTSANTVVLSTKGAARTLRSNGTSWDTY